MRLEIPTIKPILLAVGGGGIIEYISGTEFEILYKYATQTLTMAFSMFIAYKSYKSNKKNNSQ
jgi:hypothetical protein